jgi:hypothetical protein
VGLSKCRNKKNGSVRAGIVQRKKEVGNHRGQRTSLYRLARHLTVLIVQSIRRLDCGPGRTMGFDTPGIPCSMR